MYKHLVRGAQDSRRRSGGTRRCPHSQRRSFPSFAASSYGWHGPMRVGNLVCPLAQTGMFAGRTAEADGDQEQGAPETRFSVNQLETPSRLNGRTVNCIESLGAA